MQKINTLLTSNDLQLEACLDLPDNIGTACPGVVLCHPNPSYGGDMNNSVIMAVSWALTQKGIAGLRYNSRGTGQSQGTFGNGGPEQKDALAALSFLAQQEKINPQQIGIMGYSFGGKIALSVAGQSELVQSVVGVSPAFPLINPADYAKPKFIISGSEDDVIVANMVLQETAKMSDPKTVELFPGVDHFWWGYEEEIAELIAKFFVDTLIQNSIK